MHHRTVSNLEALQFHCPRCRAEPGAPCRRLSDCWAMKTAHRERRDVALAARRKLTPQERRQLVLWLLEHGRILWEED